MVPLVVYAREHGQLDPFKKVGKSESSGAGQGRARQGEDARRFMGENVLGSGKFLLAMKETALRATDGPTLSLSMSEIGRTAGWRGERQLRKSSTSYCSRLHFPAWRTHRMATEIETERAVKLSSLSPWLCNPNICGGEEDWMRDHGEDKVEGEAGEGEGGGRSLDDGFKVKKK